MRNKKLQGQTLFHVAGQKQNGLKSKESGRKSPKKKISPKGKRRLSFPSKKPGLLSGKRFYLDLVGEGKIKLTRSTICDLGGSVEEFVSKEVYCIITDRVTVEEVIAANTLNKKGTQVPLFGPSPSPLQQISSNKCYANSPLSTDSPQSFEVKTLNATRGKALLKHVAGTQRQGSTNLLENARKWKVRVLHLDQFLNWSKEKISQCKRTPVVPDKKGPRSSQMSSSFRVKSLKSPFIKIEEQSRTYRPVYVELEEWPMMHFESVAGSCPFEKPKIKDELPDKEIEQMSDKETNKDDSSQEMSEKASESPKDKKEDIKGGYCECCLVRFSNIKQHLKGDQHRAYATNDANYSELDAVISRGNTFDEFLAAIVQKSEAESSNFADSPSTSSKEIIANCFDSRNTKGKIASTNAFLETCQQEKNMEPNHAETKVTQLSANESEANSLTGVKNGIGLLEKDPESGEEDRNRKKADSHGELSLCSKRYTEDANVCTATNAEINTDTALPQTAATANIDKENNVAIDVANSMFSNSNASTAEIGITVQLNTNTALDENIPGSANAHTDAHSLTAAAIIYDNACVINNANTNVEVAAYYADDTGPGVTVAADTDAGVAVDAMSSISGIIDTNVDALATTAVDSNACIAADSNSDITVTQQNMPETTGHDRPTIDKPAKEQKELYNNLKLESSLLVENPPDIVSKLRGDDSATLDPTKTVLEGVGEKSVPKAVCDKLEPYVVCEPDKINLEKATDERFVDQDLAEKVEECELNETAEIDPSSVIKLHAESPVRRRKRTKRNFVICSSPRSEILQQSPSLQTEKTSKACSSSNSIEKNDYIGMSTEEHSTTESVIMKENTLDCHQTVIAAPGTKTIRQFRSKGIENIPKEQASNRTSNNAINENDADNEKIGDRMRCSGDIDNVKQRKSFPKLEKRLSPRQQKLKFSMSSVVAKKQRQNRLDDSSDHVNISSNDSAEEGDVESKNERLLSQNIKLPTKRCTRLSLPADLKKKSPFFSPLRERLCREGKTLKDASRVYNLVKTPECKQSSKYFSHLRKSSVVYSGSSTQSDEDTMTCDVSKEDLKFSGSSTVDLQSPERVTEITQLTSHLDDITTGAAHLDDITTGTASTTTLGFRKRKNTISESECSKEKQLFSAVPEDILVNLPKCSPESLFRSKVGAEEVETFDSHKGNLDSSTKGNSPEKYCRFSSPGSEMDYKNKVDEILCQLNSPIVRPGTDHVHFNDRHRKCKKVLAMSQPTSSTSKLRVKKAEGKENNVIDMKQSPKRRKRSRDKLVIGATEDGFRQAKRSCTDDEEWLPSERDSSTFYDNSNNIYNNMLTKRKQVQGLLDAKLLTSDSGNSIANDLSDFLVDDFQKGINMHERIKTRKRFASLVASAKSFDSPITPPKKRTNKLSLNKITCSQSSAGAACIEQKNKQFNLVSGDAEEGCSQTMYRPIKDYTGNDAVPVVTSSSTPVPNVNRRSYHRQSPKKCAKLPNSVIHRTYPRRAKPLPSESILEKSPSPDELNDSASVLSQSANSSLVTDSSSSLNTSNPVTLSISNALLSSRRANTKKKSSVQRPPGNTSTTTRKGRKLNSSSTTSTRDVIGMKKRNNRASFEFPEDEYDFTDY